MGRAAELGLLRQRLDQALAGQRQTVFVAGEPGIGKSALVRALVARAVDPGRVWIGYGQCLEAHERAEAYLPPSGGEILADDSDADDCFQRAAEVAARQGAKLLELRAAMSRARRWQRRGRAPQARLLLRRSYDWFTEGHDTPDLRDARALIAQLGSR